MNLQLFNFYILMVIFRAPKSLKQYIKKVFSFACYKIIGQICNVFRDVISPRRLLCQIFYIPYYFLRRYIRKFFFTVCNSSIAFPTYCFSNSPSYKCFISKGIYFSIVHFTDDMQCLRRNKIKSFQYQLCKNQVQQKFLLPQQLILDYKYKFFLFHLECYFQIFCIFLYLFLNAFWTSCINNCCLPD